MCYIRARALSSPSALTATSAVVRSIPPFLLTPGWSSQYQLQTFWICRQLSNSCHVLKRTRPKLLLLFFFSFFFPFFFIPLQNMEFPPPSHKNSTAMCAQISNIQISARDLLGASQTTWAWNPAGNLGYSVHGLVQNGWEALKAGPCLEVFSAAPFPF